MFPSLEFAQAPTGTLQWTDLRAPALYSLEGRIQRVNYHQGELSVVAEGRPWHFTLAADCQLWFQGRQAPLRCFHPLDNVCIFYECQARGFVANALYLWEFFP